MRYFQSWPNSLAPFTDFQTMAALSVPPAESHCSLWGQNGQYGNGLRDRQKSANILGPLPGAVIPEPRWGVWPRERFREKWDCLRAGGEAKVGPLSRPI